MNSTYSDGVVNDDDIIWKWTWYDLMVIVNKELKVKLNWSFKYGYISLAGPMGPIINMVLASHGFNYQHSYGLGYENSW